MKKTVLVVALAFGISSAFAQGLTSKKGEPYLPETGDYAISFDANPIFHYVGNVFNQNGNDNPGVGWLNGNQTIIGKKFIDEHNAYRALVRLGFTSQTDKNMVNANGVAAVFPNVNAQAEDKRKISNTNIAIGVGKEMRRGKTRLQGFYGADAMLWVSMGKTKYEYGNSMSDSTIAGSSNTITPASTDFNNPLGNGTFGTLQADPFTGRLTRTIESKSGTTIGLGVRVFVGAEYFIFPKISVGAEYGWGLGIQTTGKGKSIIETTGQNVANVSTQAEQETETSGNSRFGFDTDLNQGNNLFGFKGSNSGATGSGSLRVTFHF